MSCTSLASTGLPIVTLVAVGAGLVLAGAALLLLLTCNGRGRTAAAIVLLLAGGGLTAGIATASTAHASTPCTAGQHQGGNTSSPGSPGPSPSSSSPGSSSPGSSSPGPSSAGSSSPGPSPTAIAEDSLTIVQTSSMTGLAPGVAPAAITGTVTNIGPASTIVAAVTVSIVAVTPVAGGTCDASDYVVLDPAMPVGQTLAPGESADFAGARIGFIDKTTNQDACQSASVALRYLSS